MLAGCSPAEPETKVSGSAGGPMMAGPDKRKIRAERLAAEAEAAAMSGKGGTAKMGAGPPAVLELKFADIEPIFKANCIGCHSEGNGKDGVELFSHASVMKGGEHGAIVVPGDAKASLLSKVLRASDGKKQMPPKGPIRDNEIAKIEAWINQGAKA